MKSFNQLQLTIALYAAFSGVYSHSFATTPTADSLSQYSRERQSFDRDWRFAFGHATDPNRDYDPANHFPFNYFAKTGYAVGAAAVHFDDRGWRRLNLPHDWAVEVPFDERASNSHGSKAIGRNFPENSIGWYRKTFFIPASDLGRRISVEFDGVFRDSVVWINGHYLGREASGYSSFAYNLTEYLNYDGENVLVVRVDASLEEGWFYEGAGIYRHVWLVKTNSLHVDRHGTSITSEIGDDEATLTARVTIVNEGTDSARFDVEQEVLNADGERVANSTEKSIELEAGRKEELSSSLLVNNPNLWSLESPTLYRIITTIRSGRSVLDHYETPFGIRAIRFDPKEGCFLNGEHVRLYGTNNHQDHAGVGAAIPDALQEFRIARLKEFGCNAYRASHNPPTPELLDACDRLGMLVVVENRSMGTSDYQLDRLERMIRQDRNHPCVILWSLGNEEWSIEGNAQGERITATMQALANRLDPTRRTTLASSGNWGRGTSVPIDVMGYNYYTHGSVDDYHAQFPNKPSISTEEIASFSTRGVYVQARERQHLTAYDENRSDFGSLAREGWQYYADRNFVAGMFVWTGFDYRGETTPFGWPAVSSQFGILDTCGFRKDNSYYYQAWWTKEPMLHLFPHWNWVGREGQKVRVWAHSNCDEVELSLNDASLGRKKMDRYSYLEWVVPYAPGRLVARGYKNDKEVVVDVVETTGDAVATRLRPHRVDLKADGHDVAVITVEVSDSEGRMVPTADHEITFDISGPGRIIGVGNGDPSSHEPDQFLESVSTARIAWRARQINPSENPVEVAFDFDDSSWPDAFPGGYRDRDRRNRAASQGDQLTVLRGAFELKTLPDNFNVTLFLRSMGEHQLIYLNGELIAQEVRRDNKGHEFELPIALLRKGRNVIAIVATLQPHNGLGGDRASLALDYPAVVRIVMPAAAWKRRLFNGLAQVIIQSTEQSGKVRLTARAVDLKSCTLDISTTPTTLRSIVRADE